MKKLRTRKHRVVLSRSIGGDFGVTIFMLLLGVVMFFPMYYLIIQSLKPLDELFYFPPRMYVTNPSFENFSDLFNLLNTSWVPFSRYLFNTVFITVCGTLGHLILASMGAYALSKLPFPGHKFTFQVIQKSLMINSEVAQLMVFVIISKLGMLDSYWAIIIPALATPLGLYLMKQFIDSNVSTEILESARLDGAGEFRTFWSIAMPMVKPAWLTLIIYSFQGLWNTGQNIYIYSEQLKTLNFTINQVLLEGIVRSGASAAATVVMMIVPIVVFVISQSRIIETMGSSGMKD